MRTIIILLLLYEIQRFFKFQQIVFFVTVVTEFRLFHLVFSRLSVSFRLCFAVLL